MRTHRNTLLSTTLLLLIAAGAQAQSGSTEAKASGTASQATEGGAANAEAASNATVATSAAVRAESQAERLAAIKAKGAAVAANKRAKIDSKLKDIASAVQGEVETAAGTIVANRLSGEFKVAAEALVKQEARHSCGWGNLVIAHTLESNSDGEATVDELLELHHDHVGWAQIGAGLGYRLDDMVTAAKAEARVARGMAQADGRIAFVRTEAPGSLGASVDTRADAAAGAGNGAANVGTGIKAGASVAVPKVGH